MASSIIRVGELLSDLEQAKHVAQQNVLTNWKSLQELLVEVGELTTGEAALEVTPTQKATLKAHVEAMMTALRSIAQTLQVALPE